MGDNALSIVSASENQTEAIGLEIGSALTHR